MLNCIFNVLGAQECHVKTTAVSRCGDFETDKTPALLPVLGRPRKFQMVRAASICSLYFITWHPVKAS